MFSRSKKRPGEAAASPKADQGDKGPGMDLLVEQLYFDSPYIRQGALKAIIDLLRKETSLTKKDISRVAAELGPPKVIQVTGGGASSVPKKKKQRARKSKPEDPRLVALRNNLEEYPLRERGKDSEYAEQVREIRALIKSEKSGA